MALFGGLSIAPAAVAQSTLTNQDVRQLRKQLDDLRQQMNKLQAHSEQRPTTMLHLKRPKGTGKKTKTLQAQDEPGRSTDERLDISQHCIQPFLFHSAMGWFSSAAVSRRNSSMAHASLISDRARLSLSFASHDLSL